ncbi:MAG TPA: hypothetical protein VD931_04025 [Baekduia sp.]|nr:hypothetical protein [Baekduia sp.]
MSWPSADVALGNVAPGTTPTSAEQIINVSANTTWGIRVSADQAGGRMKEWAPSGYIFPSPRVMTNPLQWALTSVAGSAQSPSWADLSTTAANVVSGQSHTGCVLGLLCGTRDIGVTYRVRPTFSDRRAAPNSYRLLVTYDAQTGF